jgi:hypothetical protein
MVRRSEPHGLEGEREEMDTGKRESPEEREDRKAEKRPYVAPKLVKLASLKEITETTSAQTS